ncbi:tyrosine-type recombinase/integrase, partial [Acidobacteria bacterium AH-259-O06]|nr:tyrosine-type recombinase/integrase [Acidobacteria bacterium AH-259-O06]
RYYSDHRYLARRWVKSWEHLQCSEVTPEMIQRFVLHRAKEVSPHTANVEIRYLRATFNFGKEHKWIRDNPTEGIKFLPVEKRIKYIPPLEDIEKVLAAADPDTQDYLWTIRDTLARVGEINRLTWADVNLLEKYVILYTRKKKGGHLTPRKVPMTQRLFLILSRRYTRRDPDKPWLFWHRYWSRKDSKRVEGPYQYRKQLMKQLCEKAGVKHFNFHALRHSGASVMEKHNVPIGDIQRLVGHENRKTTEVYLHSIGESEREAMSIYELATEIPHTDSHTAEAADETLSRKYLN